MMILCCAPIILFLGLALFFPKLAYLSVFGVFICPIAMGAMMYFMHKKNV